MNSGSNVIDLMRPLNNILFNPTNWYQHSCLPNATLHCIAFHRSQCDCTKIVCCIVDLQNTWRYTCSDETSLARPNPFFPDFLLLLSSFIRLFHWIEYFVFLFQNCSIHAEYRQIDEWMAFVLFRCVFLSRHNSYI